MERPTGLSVYAANVVPRLAELDPIVMIRESLAGAWATEHPDLRLEPIRSDLSADDGAKGHARRLAWVETVLAKRLRAFANPALFSPVPEAPTLFRVPVAPYAGSDLPAMRAIGWRARIQIGRAHV